jgi:chaperonin GroES
MKKKLPTLLELGIIELMDDRIIVEVTNPEMKTAGGIIIPPVGAGGEEKQRIGIVIGTGPGERDYQTGLITRPMRVSPGERVMYGKYEGSDIFLEGRQYHVIRMMGIIARLTPETDEANSNPSNPPKVKADKN